MSGLFKRGIIERIAEVYTFARGPHVDLGPDGYKIAITALLGFTPTDWETDEVFRQRNSLSLTELCDIVNYKLSFIFLEQYMYDMFSKLDVNYKGYITLQDIRTAWEQIESNLQWNKIHECFRELSNENGVMDYGRFFEIISNDEDKFDFSLNNIQLFNNSNLNK